MIVAMKKVFVVVQAKDRETTIESLRRLGVVHVEYQRALHGENIRRLEEDLSLVEAAQEVFSHRYDHERTDQFEQKPLQDWKRTCQHLVDLNKRLDQLQEYQARITNTIIEWRQWGDFEPAFIEQLAGKGVFFRLYQIPVNQLKDVPDDVIVREVFRKAGMAHCVVIARTKPELGFKEITLPRLSLGAMKKRLALDEQTEEDIRKEITSHLTYRKALVEVREALRKQLEFSRAVQGMGAEGALSYLAGYVPSDAEQLLRKNAVRNHWAIAVSDPSEEDAVPTLIRSPRWVEIIRPVLSLLGITPGYRELDVSALLLVFLSLFFGILIGDAGYGIVYLGLTAWFQKKKGRVPAVKQACLLMYVFSSCAVIWGVLTGTFFGQAWLKQRGIFGLDPALNDPRFMQTVCFMLGALHLSIAHGWRAVRKLPSLSALSDIGWICILWTAFFLAKALILGDAFPWEGKLLLISGLLLVVLFASPQRNVLKAIGSGLGTIALSLVNNFTDVVSYVRLFAVGLAGVAIAEATNAMAAGFGSGFLAAAAGVLVIVFGHALNIVLGPMSVLVHGVRLNVLEFSSHASVTWSGIAYAPLKE